MPPEHLNKANITNLTNLWKLLGRTQTVLTNGDIRYASLDWKKRVWWKWEHTPQPEDIVLLRSQIKQSTPIILPMWHKMDTLFRQTLADNGFELLFEQTAMALRLGQKRTYVPTDLTFTEIVTSNEVSIWADIVSQSFGYHVPSALIEKIVGETSIKLILAWLDNSPVATALLFEDGGVVGIHLVGVSPLYRRQGIARKLMLYLLHLMQEANISFATLQASTMGEPLYEMLGFEKQFTIANFTNSQSR